MKKHVFIIAAFLTFLSRAASAQDFAYGYITGEDLKMARYDKDISAHALVLKEYGKAEITITNDDDLNLIFYYHVKIKIFDNEGFKAASREVILKNLTDNSSAESVEDITGSTYFFDQNGRARRVDLDSSKIYISRDYREQSTLKFTMPALTPGCIVEYLYRIVSPIALSLPHFHPWNFQDEIPKKYSEYEVIIPAYFNYNCVLHGFLKLTKNTTNVLPEYFSTHGSRSDCSDIVYGMSDIPAFVAEDYMTSPKNYISALSFDLVEYTNPYTNEKFKATKDWKDIDRLLKDDDDFGAQLKYGSIFKDLISSMTDSNTDNLQKAKTIYSFIQRNFKWNGYVGIDTYLGVKKAFEAHTGSIADINMSLMDALCSAGIKTEAVLLSQRDHGFVNEVYPAINDFDYMIVKVDIDGKTYLLDATDPLLPFGVLPLKCLNDKGRAFSMDKPSYWVDLDTKERETSNNLFDLTLQPDGKLKGTITRYSTGYEAYETRSAIKKFNSIEEYVEDLASTMPRVKILKSEITGLDSLENPVIEKYDVEINAYDKTNTNGYSFNPFFLSKIITNPFKLNERLYPVDMGMPSDYRTILTLHLPDGYTVDSPPANMSTDLPNNGGRFLTDYQTMNNSIVFSHIIQFNKPVYAPQEYIYLKDFFNKIILSERAEMIFKKN